MFRKIQLKENFGLSVVYYLKHSSVYLSIQTRDIHNHPKYDLSNSFKIRKDYKFIYLKIIGKLSTWTCINTKLK